THPGKDFMGSARNAIGQSTAARMRHAWENRNVKPIVMLGQRSPAAKNMAITQRKRPTTIAAAAGGGAINAAAPAGPRFAGMLFTVPGHGARTVIGNPGGRIKQLGVHASVITQREEPPP